MPRSSVVLIDTSIIVRLIGIDGEGEAKEAAEEFKRRRDEGQRLVLTVTALIEAGNRVTQQQRSNRRRYAERLKKLIEDANQADSPWILREATLDQEFVDEMIAGNSTGSDLVTLLGHGRLGTGDLAILVERDQLKRKTAHTDVSVWTLDNELSAHG
ncbi:MAG: hypothetical protein KTV16_10290 [Acidimicrobiia bacterium]|nr:hypothetical protein [Acidimicrobiia bacterium]